MSRPLSGSASAGSVGEWLLFPDFRAIELTMAMPEVRPLRIFSVRWPLWQVEVQATFEESQPFDVVDHYLLRGVVEGRLHTEDELARFFGLSSSLVARGTEHLVHIGHLQRDTRAAGALLPTNLGAVSVRDGVRYVRKESRQLLLFDAFTHRPLPRAHYDGSVRIVPAGERNTGDARGRFRPLSSARPFDLDAVHAVAARPDRDQFNVPRRLRNLHPVSDAAVWLPTHLILADEATVLAFTQAGQGRDRFIEDSCGLAPQVMHTLEGERGTEPRQIWVEWIRAQGLGEAMLTNLPNGVWRATLPAGAFGPSARQPYHRLGSFQVRDTYFLQLWCVDERARATAVRSRALAISRRYGIDRSDFDDAVAAVANLLEVPVPTFDELSEHAVTSGTPLQRQALEALR